MNGLNRKELKELYRVRALLRSQIARLDAQIIVLDRGPVAAIRRATRHTRGRAAVVPYGFGVRA